MPRELTGITLSKQMLKFFFWLALSFFKETRVSPINSLWPNLSSSHTEILEGRGTVESTSGRLQQRLAHEPGPKSPRGGRQSTAPLQPLDTHSCPSQKWPESITNFNVLRVGARNKR